MGTRVCHAALWVVLFAATAGQTVHADTITATSGWAVMGYDEWFPEIYLEGDGFVLFLRNPSADFPTFNGYSSEAPGTGISLSTVLGDGFGGAFPPLGTSESDSYYRPGTLSQTAVVGGATLATPNDPASQLGFSGQLSFDAEAVRLPAAAAPGSTTTLTAPFVLTGTILGFRCPFLSCSEGLEGLPVLRVDVFGRGTVRLDVMATETGGWRAASFKSYAFEDQVPVPEPGSLLLLGSGLAYFTYGRRAVRRNRCAQRMT